MNYSYDANGRMFKTTNTANTSGSNAVYDANGQRVAQQIDGGWTYFIYDAFGNLVAEYGGQPVYDEGGIKYVYQDWQGSTRAVMGAGGAVLARSDYTAFGEEIGASVGQRTAAQGFNANNTLNQKYALTERDKATGLDHTWFRKHENRAGRWTSPDPYNGSMNSGDPQSFNRYAYVSNQPTNFVDPSGLSKEGEKCTITAPDGTVYEGRKDKDGNCQFTFNNGFSITISGSDNGIPPFLADVFFRSTTRGNRYGNWYEIEPFNINPPIDTKGFDKIAQRFAEEKRKREAFEKCVKEKMSGLRTELNNLMDNNFYKWRDRTGVGGFVGAVKGLGGLGMGALAGSFTALLEWDRQFQEFKSEKYDPALTKAIADCREQTNYRGKI